MSSFSIEPFTRLPLSVAFASLLLVSCGGGGSSNSGSGGTPVSTAPRFTSAASISVVENAAGTIYTATATDPQNDPVSFSVYSGPDASRFAIDGSGNLRFDDPPNYDLPSDSDQDNVYQVTLRATAGGESADLSLAVTVTNDKEGIAVRRVATGFIDPVAISFVHNEATLLIAERSGRVMEFDPASGNSTENILVRDNRIPGEVLAMAYGYPDNPFQRGIYLLTHDASQGLYLQAFGRDTGRLGRKRLGGSWARPVKGSMIAQGSVFIAIGSPNESDAQESISPYGKLIELGFYDPYAGASLPPSDELLIRDAIIGDGIQNPGGFTPNASQIFLADQGSTVEHEIAIFQPDWRPLDFGWPFYEGSQAVRSNPPSQVNGPTLAYAVGDGRKEGSGVVAGLVNDYNFFEELGNVYVFADSNGTIWTIDIPTLNDGLRHYANDFEVRNEDFEPDQGSIDSPIGFAIGSGSDHFYILDADGEIFRVEGAP